MKHINQGINKAIRLNLNAFLLDFLFLSTRIRIHRVCCLKYFINPAEKILYKQ